MLEEQKELAVFEIGKLLYKRVLRPLIIDKVKESETTIDDIVLKICDVVFGYVGK